MIEPSPAGIVTQQADLSQGLRYRHRKDRIVEGRSGNRWFLGGVYAGAAHAATVPLTVGRGQWLVQTIRDGAEGLVQESQVLRGGDDLSVDVVADGGFAGIACPWHQGVTTCYR
ncbi:hypothetical protein AB0N16_41325 [Streptomyces sp. NPDC051105]|uniref:hypothetical protein n=1 Tax=Streptomyces sp. NPDC051105 TaxID=3154843 RepID=UPI00342761EF